LKEFGRGVDVQEDTIIEALNLASVSWPHDEAKVVQVTLLIVVEELGKTADLFVVLLV